MRGGGGKVTLVFKRSITMTDQDFTLCTYYSFPLCLLHTDTHTPPYSDWNRGHFSSSYLFFPPLPFKSRSSLTSEHRRKKERSQGYGEEDFKGFDRNSQSVKERRDWDQQLIGGSGEGHCLYSTYSILKHFLSQRKLE